jgi:sulfur carrier protein ThiS
VVVTHDAVVVNFEGERRQVASGTTVEQFLIQALGTVPRDVVAALVNRRLVMLDFPILGFQVDLETVRTSSREGEAVARQSASIVLIERFANSTLRRDSSWVSRSAAGTSTRGSRGRS